MMNYRTSPGGSGSLSPCVRELLMLSVGMFFLQMVLGPLMERYFALHSNWLAHLAFWQPLTYIFLHGGFGHILWNMLALFLLGPAIERELGWKHFLILYLVSGVLGGVGWALLSSAGICVGASGAIFGVLAAYGALFPNARMMLIFPPVTMKAWQLVLLFGVIEFFQINSQSGGSIANSAHLAGGLAGFAYALSYIRVNEPWRYRRLFQWLDRIADFFRQNWENRRQQRTNDIDRILDKVAERGIDSLTERERKVLEDSGKKR